MPPTNDKRRLLVFAKAPRPGEVKTRLIPLLGAEGAAALHAKLIKHTLTMVRQAALGPIELHGTPADDDFLRHCSGRYDARLVEQCAGDLGARMRHAFEQALSDATAAILIGTDCPALTPRHLRQAAQALSNGNDAVFCAVEDGGYALIALSRCDSSLFGDISWSTATVMQQTRERLTRLRYRWTELDPLWDIDRPADYERLVASGLLDRGRAVRA